MLAGEALSPGGLVTMVDDDRRGPPRFHPAQISHRVRRRGRRLWHVYADEPVRELDFDFFALSRMVVGLGLPFMFIPITVASYDGIAAAKTDQASALINLARNFGGSIGVSLSQTVLAQREQFHQLRLAEHVGAWNPLYDQTLSGAKGFFAAQPCMAAARRKRLSGGSAQTVQSQASYLSYVDVFWC